MSLKGYIIRKINDFKSSDSLKAINDNFEYLRLKLSGNLDGDDLKDQAIGTQQIKDLAVDSAKIGEAQIKSAHIDNAQIKTAHIGDAQITNAKIGDAEIDTAKIADASITSAKIGDAQIKSAHIDDAQIETAHIQDASITNAKILDGTIGSAKIESVRVNQLEAGTVDTSKIDLASPDGRMIIKDNSILIYDYVDGNLLQPFLRVQNGRLFEIVNGELVPTEKYGFEVRDEDGQTIMIDGQGVHNAGITDGAVDNAKIAPNANIDGSKLDIASVINHINGDGTTTIQGSKIYLDNKTLDVKITEMTQATDNAQTKANLVDGALSRLTTAESNITQNANEIALRVTKTEFDSLQIGGRNLIKNSKDVAVGYPDLYWFKQYELTDKNINNKTVTMSFTGRTVTPSVLGSKVVLILNNSSWSFTESVESISNKQEFHRVSKTFSIPEWVDPNDIFIAAYHFEVNNGGMVEIKEVKLEIGNKATDWTPAPEDIQGQIDGVSSRLTTAESSITQQANQIALKVTQTEINNSINALQVGGRNLVKGATKHVEIIDANWKYFELAEKLIEGQTYILGGQFRIDAGSLGVIILNKGDGNLSRADIPLNEPFVATNFMATLTHLAFANQLGVGVVSGDNVKLEKGTKSTDWTPAPEDTYAKISGLTFKNIVDVKVEGNDIIATGTTATWSRGCSSNETLTNGQYIEFTIKSGDKFFMAGLNNYDEQPEYPDINYAFYIRNEYYCQIFEDGNQTFEVGFYNIGDVFRVSVENGKVNYYQNGELKYTSLKVPPLPLVFDCSIYDVGAVIKNVKVGTMLSGIAPRLATAELKITPSAIVQAINTTEGVGKVKTVSATLDDTGFTITNGKISIKNNAGVEVLKGDVDGNLLMTGDLTTTYYYDSGTTYKYANIEDGMFQVKRFRTSDNANTGYFKLTVNSAGYAGLYVDKGFSVNNNNVGDDVSVGRPLIFEISARNASQSVSDDYQGDGYFAGNFTVTKYVCAKEYLFGLPFAFGTRITAQADGVVDLYTINGCKYQFTKDGMIYYYKSSTAGWYALAGGSYGY